MSDQVSAQQLAVLAERMSVMEKKVEGLEAKQEKLDEKVDGVVTFNGRIEVMLMNLVEKQRETDKKIDKLIAKQEQDSGWRAVLLDFIKLAGLIVVAVATGKFVF